MGMNHGAKVLNSLRGLLTQHVATILRGMAREHNMAIPTMDVDCRLYRTQESVEATDQDAPETIRAWSNFWDGVHVHSKKSTDSSAP